MVALVVILFWPGRESPSLAVKAVNVAADPFHRLPVLPPPLPLGLGDDAEAVILHDTQENAYYDAYGASGANRLRMMLRDWRDPLDATTERQILVGLVVFGALLVWRLEGLKAARAWEADSENLNAEGAPQPDRETNSRPGSGPLSAGLRGSGRGTFPTEPLLRQRASGGGLRVRRWTRQFCTSPR